MARSETILGRKRNREAWASRRRHNGKLTRMRWGFTVSAFRTRQGKLFYTDPIDAFGQVPKPSVLYRVRVYPKGERYEQA